MKTRDIAVLKILWLCTFLARGDYPPNSCEVVSPNRQFPYIAIIHMSTLRFEDIASQTGVWAVVSIEDAKWGILGGGVAHYNQNGDLLIPAGREDPAIFNGHWRLDELLTGHLAQTGGHYRLLVRRGCHWISELSREVLGEPGRGPILCRLDVNANWVMTAGLRHGGVTTTYRGPKDIGFHPAMFSPLYEILPGWESYVKPAYERFLALSSLWEGKVDERKEKGLRALMRDSNPLLATMAFRRLVESDRVGDLEMSEILAQAEDYRISVLIFLWLSAKSERAPDGVRSAGPIMSAATRAKDVETLERLAMGAYAVACWSAASLKASQEVLAVAMEALEKQGKPTDVDTQRRRRQLRWPLDVPTVLSPVHGGKAAAETQQNRH